MAYRLWQHQGFLRFGRASKATRPNMTFSITPMTPDRTLTITLRAPSLTSPRAANVTPRKGRKGIWWLLSGWRWKKKHPRFIPLALLPERCTVGVGKECWERGLGFYGVPLTYEAVAVGKQVVSTELSC